MAKFTGELSGSLAFIKNGVVETRMVPGAQSLQLTGSLNITGSRLTVNGRNILSEIDSLTAGADPEVGNLRIHSASMLLYTGSTNARLDGIEAVTGSISQLNAATSSYFLKSDSANIVSSSTQIEALGFAKDNIVSSSLQIINLGFNRDVVSGSQQILDLGFVTSSNIASYNDLYDVPQGIVSSSVQISGLGFITGSQYNELVNIPNGIVSGSTQLEALLLNNTVNFGTGHVTASKFSGDGSGLTNLNIGQVSSIRQGFDATGSVTVNHNFESLNVNVAVYDSNNYYIIPSSIQLISSSSVKINFATETAGHAVVSLGGHIFTSSVAYSELSNIPSDIISSSAQITALGFGGGITDIPAGTISSSAQITELGFLTGSIYADLIGIPNGIVSSSDQISNLGFLTSASAAALGFGSGNGGGGVSSYTDLTNIPGGIVSSSAQILGLGFITGSTFNDIVDKPSGIISSSAQITALGYITSSHADVDGLNAFTGSIQSQVDSLTAATSSYLTSLPQGILSSSAQIEALGFITSSGIASVPAGTISSSAQISELGYVTSSDAADVSGLNSKTGSYATTGSNTFIGNQVVTGSIIPGAITNDLGTATAPWQHLYISSGSIKFMSPDGVEISSFNNTFNGNQLISNTEHPLFNTYNPGTDTTIEAFLNAVFFPNTAPSISTGNQTVAEFTPSGSSIVTLTGTDGESQTITYSLDDSYTDGFVVVEGGVLKLNVLPTVETFNTADRGDGVSAHPVVIKATDTAGGSSTKTIYILISTNTAPKFRETSTLGNIITSFTTSRNENSSAGLVTRLYFTDSESDTITIRSGSNIDGHFSLTKYSTYVELRQVTASLDYESKTQYNLSITASDQHYEDGDDLNAITYLPITINVTDNVQPVVNDQTLSGIDENSSAGTSAGTITATDSEGDTIVFTNARLHSIKLDGSNVATGSYGGSSQSDPTEDAFTISSNGAVTRKAGAYINSDIINSYIYEVTVTDAYNNGTDTGLITIPISDDTAPTITGDTTLYVIESATSGDSIYDNTNGYSGTTSRFTANQTVTWAVSSSNDFNISSTGYLTLARDISGSATVGGDQLAGVVTATNNFGTSATRAFTVNVTDNAAPTITFTNTSANLNTNKAKSGTTLVTLTFSDAEGNGIDYNSFSASFAGAALTATKVGSSYLISPTSNLTAGTYSITASIADDQGFETRTSSHAFTIAQAVTGTLTTNGTFRIIESATSGDNIVTNSDGRTGTQGDLGVTYSPNYGTQIVQAFTSSNAAIVVASNGNLSLGLDISGSLTGSGDTIVSDITFQDQYGNIGSGSITVNVVQNTAPTVTISEQAGLETDTISGSLAATVSVSDTELDYPITLTLSGTDASSFTANANNANGTAWNITASAALSAGTYTFAVTASDSFGKEGYDTATVVVAQSADYGKVYVYTSTYGSDAGFASSYNAVMGAATVNSDVPPQVTSYTANTESPYYKIKTGAIGDSTISLAGGASATLRATGSGAGLDSVLNAIGSISANTTGQIIIIYPSGSDMAVPTSIQESFNSTSGGAVPAMNVDGNGWGIESGVIHSLVLDSPHLGYTEWFVFGRKSQNAIASNFNIRLIDASIGLPS